MGLWHAHLRSAPLTFAAGAFTGVCAGFTILEFARPRAIAHVRAVACWRGIRLAERNIRAGSGRRCKVAGLARRGACIVATNAIGAEGALALHPARARVAVALLAVRSPAIHARFVSVHHAIAARNAILLETARVCPRGAIAVVDAFDAHPHIVAHASAAARPHGIVHDHRNAVVTAFRGARVAVKGWRVAVVVHLNDISHAVATVSLAVTVGRVVDDHSLRRERRGAHAHRAAPVGAGCVVRTIAAVIARHATAAAAARTSAAATAAGRTTARTCRASTAATHRTAARVCRYTPAFTAPAPLALLEQRGLGDSRDLSARAEAQEQRPAEDAHGDARRRRLDVLRVVSLPHDKPPLDG